MAAVFPDAAACLENIPGDRQIPDHPLVKQTVRDCLEEAMDYPALAALLDRIHAGGLRIVARDTPEPSPLAHEILNARPYAFLDDAPLEARRARPGPTAWLAAERIPEFRAIHPDAVLQPPIDPPPSRAAKAWTREDAIAELLRGRLTIVGPTTAAALAATFGVEEADIETALVALES